MRKSPLAALWSVLALALFTTAPHESRAQDTTRTAELRVQQLLAPVIAASRSRDSLSAVSDKASGEQRTILEEQVWQQQLEFQAALLAAAGELEKLKAQGGDLAAAQSLLKAAVRSGWPRYLRQLERRGPVLAALIEQREAASPTQRLAIETEISEYSERTAKMYRDLVEAMLVVEQLGVDVGDQRSFMVKRLTAISEQTSARMTVLGRNHALAAARVQHRPDDAEAQAELDALEASFDRTTQNLETEIVLLERLGVDATSLKVKVIVSTGRLTAAIFQRGVIAGLFGNWRDQLAELVATRGPHWLFLGLMVALLLTGFSLLARLTRTLVGRAVARAGFSQLLKDTATSWSARLVMMIGIVVVLNQLGVQLGPMLAGLGIAGLVLGFALQDTLSNFAAGGMILAYHPYDVGDIIEAGGAMGTVKNMSLVSTTVLTFDNHTLIVPNKKMWGDVIRNITAQDRRRVDLTFAVGYEDDIAKVERLLHDIVIADQRVLKDPAPVIKLNQLADSSVNFVVRAWVLQQHYWDVYWDLTRAVKLRFDEEGIKIPFPQRELHVNMLGGRLNDPT
jgi:small conductance mechanosensitive channel